MSEQVWSLATPSHVNFDAISRGMPEWTAADLAIACKGLPRLPFAAAMYSLAGDDAMWARLRTGLLEFLLLERELHQWAHRVERIDGERTRFGEELVCLFLAEERRPAPWQAAPELRARALRVEPETWRRVILHQWGAISSEYRRWLSQAEGHVIKKFRRAY
jgi:hypothetical protein